MAADGWSGRMAGRVAGSAPVCTSRRDAPQSSRRAVMSRSQAFTSRSRASDTRTRALNSMRHALNSRRRAFISMRRASNSMRDAFISMRDAVQSMRDAVQSMRDAVQSMPPAVQSMRDAVQSMPRAVQSMRDAVQSMPPAVQSTTDALRNRTHARKRRSRASAAIDAGPLSPVRTGRTSLRENGRKIGLVEHRNDLGDAAFEGRRKPQHGHQIWKLRATLDRADVCLRDPHPLRQRLLTQSTLQPQPAHARAEQLPGSGRLCRSPHRPHAPVDDPCAQ
jgi:hypothetical protein